MKLTKQEKQKEFLKSKKWKEFRKSFETDKDYITGARLYKGYNVHHMNPANYEKISNRDDFLPLNKRTHMVIEFIRRLWVKDHSVLDRIKEVMEKMDEYL